MKNLVIVVTAVLIAISSCSTGRSVKPIEFKNRLLIAVADFQNITKDPEYDELLEPFNGNFIFALQKTQCFRLVERKRLQDLLKEHQLNMTGLTDFSKSQEIGKLLGVDAILMGNLVAVNHRSEVSKAGIAKMETEYINVILDARIVSIKTGEILASAKSESSFKNTFKSLGDLKTGEKADKRLLVKQVIDKAADEISRELAVQISNM